MADIDTFSTQLFEEAKRFLEKAKEEKEDGKTAYLHAALLIAVSSFEAHINALSDEFLTTYNDLHILEKSVLYEKEVTFDNGSFHLAEKLKMYRSIERFEFIFVRFGRIPLNKSDIWWSQLKNTLRIRNELVHPKVHIELNETIVSQALESILEGLNAVYKSTFKKPYPDYGLKLDSKLTF